MPGQPRSKPLVRIPLRSVFIVPFVAQVALVVGLVGYLSFRHGRQAVNDIAHQLQSEISARIEEHLYAFLDTPQQINRVNANAIRQGLLDANDPKTLEHHFWEQIQVFDSVTSIYFGNTEGGIVNAGREEAEGSLYVIVTDEFASGPFSKFATDSEGSRTDLLVTIPDFDARTRPWYAGAVEKGDATWSDVYILFTGHDMAVAASRPVFDERQNLLGVVSVDIFVSHISSFLKSLEIGETGQGFIMERSGLLVASSTDEHPFTDLNGDEAQRRLHAKESTIPIIRYAAEFLTDQLADYHNVTGEQQFEFDINGQRQFLQVAPVQDEYGIDWLIVVVIPESDFMARINANNRTTAFLLGAALIVAVVAGIVTAWWVTRPISCLNDSIHALTRGEWKRIDSVERIDEISELALSFNNMARQLRQTLESLTSEIAERVRAEEKLSDYSERLKEMVEDRTQELQSAQQRLIRQEKLAVLGQLAGGVGHELRNPLGVISNAVYFLQMVLSDADETTQEYLRIINSEVHNAEKIVSDLLDFSRTRPAEREEAAVSELVAKVLERQPPPENVDVTTGIASDLPAVSVDPRQIGQVLTNLVTNAFQAMPDGGELSISARAEEGYVHLSVTDTGYGISPEDMNKIFEPLFTTRARGIGLGLAVSKNLAEVNGGSIQVESREGQGSTFTVALPTREVKL
jgi:signal transduction histidine kinase